MKYSVPVKMLEKGILGEALERVETLLAEHESLLLSTGAERELLNPEWKAQAA
ncbi:MAG: hypothetical protein GTO14_05475 [Anaerolineales bacterium]|nr:hypothetical protein [Anaerolineales bacterium]